MFGHGILFRPPGGRSMTGEQPLLSVRGLTSTWDGVHGCRDISFDLHPGEVLCVVGESGSGKSTLLQAVSRQLPPDSGSVWYDTRDRGFVDLASLSSAHLRLLARTDWGFVRQNPRDGLREEACGWLQKMEIDAGRLDDAPAAFSGGMQQRLQIARNLVTHPRMVFMDEPTAALDVSVQARLLDLLRQLVADLGLAAIVVTHDLPVARLLAHRTLVMRGGHVVESRRSDQILDDPQHPCRGLVGPCLLQN